ncbi:hypothetical protein Tco_1257150 [Tanacetum coccineum]
MNVVMHSSASTIHDYAFVNLENEKLKAENERISKEFKDVQESLLKRILILEHDFQRCQAQGIAFELELQNREEKDVCENSWMSKLKQLADENVSLTFQVESITKENKHLKLEYQNLFNSIKKTRTQTQKEINELIDNVNQKTYEYGDVQSKNQDL